MFDHFQFALIDGPDIPGSYALFLFTASDLASITNPIHNWVLLLRWLHPFILSGVTSPLFSSSILAPTDLGSSFSVLSFCLFIRVMVESSDKKWSTGEGNGKPLQYSCIENPMNSMKRQNNRILNEELPRSVGVQYATRDQWRNNSRKNEGMEPKQKQYPAVDVTGDRSKVRCCKEQYCIGTWNVRFMNQGKLKAVKQEMQE